MKARISQILILLMMLFEAIPAGASSVEIKYENLRNLLETRNSKVESMELERQAAMSRKGSLARSFLPQIELHGAQESFLTGVNKQKVQPSYGAEIQLNLFNGGRDKIESEIKNFEADRKAVQLQQIVSEELQEVRKIFWNIVYTHERLSQVDEAIRVNNQNLTSAEKRIRSGVATDSDRVEFEMKAVDLKRENLRTKMELTNLKREFSVLMNFKTSDELIFPKQLEHNHDFEELLKHEPQDHDFLFKDDQLKSQQTDLAAQSQRRAWWPELEAFASYNQYNQRIESAGSDAENDMRQETVVGLRLKMEIGNVLQSSREVSALAHEARADQKRADFKKRQVEAHMENELSELRFLHDQVHDAETNIERAERYYKLTQSEYARGVKNSPDVLGASEKLFENRLKRIEIIKEFQIAKAHVLSKIGK